MRTFKTVLTILFVLAIVVVSGEALTTNAASVNLTNSVRHPFVTRIAQAAVSTVTPQEANQPLSTTLSENWSGYSANSGNYTSITGTWTVPTVQTSQTVAADATWVGIGGSGTKDLIQAGTEAITEKGQVLYQAWYELLPDDSSTVALTVKPGDSITTTITETSTDVWQIMIRDTTTDQQYTTSVHYTSSLGSAEWVQEMPSDGSGFLPLDSFGSVAFSNGSVTSGGVSQTLAQAGASAITLVNGRSILATPSALTSDGAGFTVTRSNNDSGIAPRSVVRRGFIRGPQGDDSASSTSVSSGTSGASYAGTPGDDAAQIQQIIQAIQSNDGSARQLLEQLLHQAGSQTPMVSTASNGTQTQSFSVGPWTVHVTTSQE